MEHAEEEGAGSTTAEDHRSEETSGSPTLNTCRGIYRVAKTICLMQLFVIVGLESAIIGPTLIDLSQLTGCNYEELSRALSAKFAGMVIGSFVAGILTDRFVRHRDGLLLVYLLLMALGVAVVPWLQTLWELAIAIGLQGIARGCLSATSNVVIVKLWGPDAPGPMQLIHMGYGFGTILAPLIAEPFLSQQNHTTNGTHPTINLYTSTEGNVTDKSLLYIPYGIAGGWSAFTALTFLVFYFLPNPYFKESSDETSNKSLCEILSPRSCSGGQTAFGVTILTFIFFIYVSLVGKDVSIGTFLFTIAVEGKLHFSKTQASYWNTAFFACYSFGRLLASGASYLCSTNVMFFAEVIFNAAVVVAIVFVGLKSIVFFWILSLLFNIFAGPMFPSGITWMSQYIEVKGMTLAVLDIGTGVAGIIFSWLSGYLYQYGSAEDVIYLSLGCNICLLFTLIIAQIFIYCYPKNTSNSLPDDEQIDEQTPLIN